MNKEARRKNLLLVLSFVLLVFADQLSKYLIRSQGGFYICNKNIAFGILVSNSIFFILWLAIMLALAILLISKLKAQSPNQIQNTKTKKFNIWILDFIWNNLDFEIWIYKISFLPLILILSGALSNIIDRLIHGCVIDFIDLKVWPVFNLADVFITLGAIFLVYTFIKKEGENIFS